MQQVVDWLDIGGVGPEMGVSLGSSVSACTLPAGIVGDVDQLPLACSLGCTEGGGVEGMSGSSPAVKGAVEVGMVWNWPHVERPVPFGSACVAAVAAAVAVVAASLLLGGCVG